MNKVILIAAFLMISTLSFSQKKLLQSGPMVGYSEMFEVMLWVQTNSPAKVKIQYRSKTEPKTQFWTNSVQTEKDKAFTAKLLADQVLPSKEYTYTLYINDKKVSFDYPTKFQTQKLWKWRTDAPEFSFACGSGAFINEAEYDRPGKGYGGDYEIYENIPKQNPDFMVWLGDNIYLREPDWNTQTGFFHRYTHTRSTPEMQALLAGTHQYAILDDHDYGPNDSDRSFWNKNVSLNTFDLFWANPSTGVGDIKAAVSYFSWGDCDFFMLDNRTFRTPNYRKEDNKTQLGKEQLEWLKDNLSSSHATFKFVVVGGQFLSTCGMYETYANYGFAAERQEIIDYIHFNEIRNVIFLTGDRHQSEISVLKRDRKPTIYDITVSALTSRASRKNENEVNPLRVEESIINVKNFGLIKLSGVRNERVLSAVFHDTSGKEIYRYEIKEETKKGSSKKH